MEENNKLTYEQLEQAAVALQQRAMQAEAKLASLNMTTLRLDYLFKVLKYEDSFDTLFTQKCVEEIKSLLELGDGENPSEESLEKKPE